MIEQAIYERLRSDGAIASRVTDSSGTLKGIIKIFPDVLPQKVRGANLTYPAIRYVELFGESQSHLLGGDGYGVSSIQVDVFAETAREAKEIAELVRQRMHAFRGTVGEKIIKGCLLQTRRSSPERPEHAGDQWTYRTILDFEIVFAEAETVTP